MNTNQTKNEGAGMNSTPYPVTVRGDFILLPKNWTIPKLDWYCTNWRSIWEERDGVPKKKPTLH